MGRAAKPTPTKHCRHCGARMDRRRVSDKLVEGLAAFSKRAFCGRGCMAAAMEKDRCTSASHSRMKSARTAGPECEACGAADRKMHVHHRDGDHFNNSPSNLRTLCVSCHMRSHSPNFMADGVTRKPCEHCEKPSVKLGLCATHLSRLRRHGHPLAKKRKVGSGWVLEIAGHG